MAPPLTIIGCGIFQEEIEHLLAGEKEPPELIWLEVGLHDDLEKLAAALDAALAGARGAAGLLFGFGCLPEMRSFAAERGLVCLEAKNCLAALAGGEDKLRELEKGRTLVASPGWVRKMWLGRAGVNSGWTADDYRVNFGRYDRAVVLDPGFNPLTDEEIITCYDLIETPLETRPLDLAPFRSLWLAFLAAARGGR